MEAADFCDVTKFGEISHFKSIKVRLHYDENAAFLC